MGAGTGIYHRGGVWVVRYREGGRQRSQSFDRKSDAEAFRIERRRARQLGAHAPAEASPMALRQWLETWMRREGPRWSAETRERRAELIDRWIVPQIGGVRLKDLGTERLAEYRAEITAAGASADRANKALALLSAALSIAVRDRRLPANPCRGLGTLPTGPVRKRVLTPREVELLVWAMPTLRDRLLTELLFYAGLRPGEALGLDRGSVGEDAVEVWRSANRYGELKEPKSGLSRTVSLVPPLRKDLGAHMATLAHGQELLFSPVDQAADWRGAGPLLLSNWRRRVWLPAVAAAAIAPCTPYDGRRTFISLMIHAGATPVEVAAEVGHSNARMIWERYASLFRAAQRVPKLPIADQIARARKDLARPENVPQMFPDPDARGRRRARRAA